MADVHDIETRSFNMSMIKGKNTKPELLVRKFLFKNGYRYRLNYAKLPGSPDIVLPKHQTVIFINGCFWHGHDGCKYYVLPKTRKDWWLQKITKTKKRDKFNSDKLKELGWSVQIIWECKLKPISFEKTLNQLLEELQDKIL